MIYNSILGIKTIRLQEGTLNANVPMWVKNQWLNKTVFHLMVADIENSSHVLRIRVFSLGIFFLIFFTGFRNLGCSKNFFIEGKKNFFTFILQNWTPQIGFSLLLYLRHWKAVKRKKLLEQ